jgi:MFS transporter, ACS family, tartrate transporter
MDAGVITNETIGTSFINKALWRILPLILIAHLFAYMDRFNVRFAAAA